MSKNKDIRATSVSRFFSSSLIKELARKGHSPLFARLLHESGLMSHLKSDDTVASAFDRAFDFLKYKGHRHEYVYKAAIAHKILLGKHSLKTASMMNEFRIKDCKADVVILNGTGTVYEIKSERDSLSRLKKQIETYRKVFASVNVIVGENHVKNVLNSVPDDVGVMRLTSRYHIHTVRPAESNPDRTDSAAIFEAITLKEAELIMKSLGLTPPRVPNTIRYKTFESLFKTISSAEAHMQMVRVLKQTRELTHLEPVISKLPSALQSVALSTRLNRAEFVQLIAVMPVSVGQAVHWAEY